MPSIINLTDDRPEEWPSEWPRKENSVSQHDVTAAQHHSFTKMVDHGAGEREIEVYFRENPNSCTDSLDVLDRPSHELDFSKAANQTSGWPHRWLDI